MTDFDPTLFVTFVFNHQIGIEEARQALEKFHGQLDRKLVGRAFLRNPDKRSTYIATIEKPDANIHIHALFKLTEAQKLQFALVANEIWGRLIRGGNLDIQPVHCVEGVADYITKELKPETSDRLLLPRHKDKAASR
jgi:hypothetical protein